MAPQNAVAVGSGLNDDEVQVTSDIWQNRPTLELFFGDANDAEARVYARLPADGPLDGWQLSGRLIGPECRFAKTLPATIQFTDRGPGAGLLAEAVIPDPCFWTPELPFLYRCSLEVRRVAVGVQPSGWSAPAKSGTQTFERWFGIRRLGAIGQSLHLDAERWVARGVCRERAKTTDLIAARDASAVLRVPAPDDSFCLEASRLGVPLFVDLDHDESRVVAEIRRLGQWPAVFAILLDPSLRLGKETRAAARNTLFAARIEPAKPTALPNWAQMAVYRAEPVEAFASAIHNCTIPIIAVRQLPETVPISAARAACDRLQFDLAPIGDFAGYFV